MKTSPEQGSPTVIHLKNILTNISPALTIQGNTELDTTGVQFDSRRIRKGDLFVAVGGTASDGHLYIKQAIDAGATAIVCERLPPSLDPQVAYIQVADSALALGQAAAAFYGYPSESLKLVAVTGTNGKTTVATLLYRLFTALGHRCGLLSTVENIVGTEAVPAKLTTPDAVSIQALMRRMVDSGCTHCFMEASSHAIVQQRMAGLKPDGAVFTNITHDHLDYHQTFDNYIKAKKMLFDGLPANAFALVNADDKRGAVMLQNCAAARHTYALKTPANFRGRLVENSFDGLCMDIDGKQAWFRLIGFFNAYNLLSVYASAVLLGGQPEKVLEALTAIGPVNGRFQQAVSPKGVRAVVDYAHTPDALENVLTTIGGIRRQGQKIITVVGCGGDRDKTKRPVMAGVAAKLSDRVLLTSDNPRSEDPQAIIDDMWQGVPTALRDKVSKLADRRQAIAEACGSAAPGDVVLVAGKGHEDYQEIMGVRHHFDDLEAVHAVFGELENTPP